jgi:tetratricopeptide (TPR) repeat protein
LDEAYAIVKAAIEVNPQYAEAYNNLGVLYRDEGEIKKAIACYDKCLALNAHSRNASQNRLLAMNCTTTSGLTLISNVFSKLISLLLLVATFFYVQIYPTPTYSRSSKHTWSGARSDASKPPSG